MDKSGSVIDRMSMKLGSQFLKSLRIKTQLLKRLRRVIVVDGATRSQKDGVKGNGCSLKNGAEAFMLFLRGAQPFLQSSVITVLDLNEFNVTLENAEIFGLMLSEESGSVDGGWRCCRSAPGLPQPQLPPVTPKNPSPFVASLLPFCFCRDGSNQYSIRMSAAIGIWRFCIASRLLLPISMQRKQDPWSLSC
jgi:hypothetical protein